MSPGPSRRRECDRLLQRIRALVRESERDDGRKSVELDAKRREIAQLKSELANVVKRTERQVP
jgi:hypothetical protein